MPSLEDMLRQVTAKARRPKTTAAALWPMPDDPALLPDLIQTGAYPDEAQTGEERCQAVHDARERALWDYLALSDRTPGPLPWAACPPPIWDPGHMLNGEHSSEGWASTHPLMDYYPSPLGGLQHRVTFIGGRFVGHGVPASRLPSPPG